MKKLVLISVAGMASLGLAANALAGGPDHVASANNSGFYAGVHGGVADAGGQSSGYNQFLDTGYNAGAQVGYRFNKNFRAEVAATYMRQKMENSLLLNDANLDTTMLMANGYYDIDLGSAFVPFVGAGIGYYHQADAFKVDNNTTLASSLDDQFAYQGIAGVAYHINKNVSVDAAYHYVGWTNNDGAHQNLFNVGLNYYFS